MPTPSTELFRFAVARAPRGLEPGWFLAPAGSATTSFETLALQNASSSSRVDLSTLAANFLAGQTAIAVDDPLLPAAARVINGLERALASSGAATVAVATEVLRDSGFEKLASGADRTVLSDRFWSTLAALHCAPAGDVGRLLALTNTARALHLQAARDDGAVLAALRAPLALPLSRIKSAYTVTARPPAPDPVKQEIAKGQRRMLKDLTVLHGLVDKLGQIETARERSLKAPSKSSTTTATAISKPLSTAERKRLTADEARLLSAPGMQDAPLQALLPQMRLHLQQQAERTAAVGRAAYRPAPRGMESSGQQTQLAMVTVAQLSLGPLATLLGDGLYRGGLALDLIGDVVPLPDPDHLTEGLMPRVRPLGVLDLKLVETQLKHYRLGEVAHVENVLASEFRERVHKREDTVEEVLLTETETSQESERNLESTERFELRQEVSRVVNEQMQVTAGVNVSAYGPSFSVGVNAGFSYGRSQQDSQKASSQYAKEVVEKSRDKVESRIREQRTTTRRVVVQESNTHRFDNTGADSTHKVGIYRFIDKVYDARLLNYGRRMMFEFLVPEPAAAIRNTERQTSAKPAPLPELDISADQLHAGNYQHYAGLFGARDIVPPPPRQQAVSVVLARSSSSPPGDGSATGPVLLSGEIAVPVGYAPISFRITAASSGDGERMTQHWSVGEVTSPWGGIRLMGEFTARAPFPNPRPVDKIPAWVLIGPTRQAVASVTVECERQDSALQSWQSATFQKIQEAYEIRLADTLEANRRLENQQRRGVGDGSNPQINRRREREELMRGCVTAINSMLLQGTYFDAVTVSDGGVVMDVDDALREGQTVRFFQGAFEWDNMTYDLFPYFWGKRERWPEMILASHADAKFEEFLRSGFARVTVPVKPGQETNVLNFLSLGLTGIFDGARESVVDDPEYLALLADLDAPLDPPLQEGAPWEVVVPTTLVKLQLDGEEELLGLRGTT